MSDKEIQYEQQTVVQTFGDVSTVRDNRISFGDSSINISRVDTTSSETKHDKTKVFGTYLQVKSPYKMGKLFTFLFYNNQPIFAIGPQCIYILHRLYVYYTILTYQYIQCYTNNTYLS